MMTGGTPSLGNHQMVIEQKWSWLWIGNFGIFRVSISMNVIQIPRNLINDIPWDCMGYQFHKLSNDDPFTCIYLTSRVEPLEFRPFLSRPFCGDMVSNGEAHPTFWADNWWIMPCGADPDYPDILPQKWWGWWSKWYLNWSTRTAESIPGRLDIFSGHLSKSLVVGQEQYFTMGRPRGLPTKTWGQNGISMDINHAGISPILGYSLGKQDLWIVFFDGLDCGIQICYELL